MGNIKGILSTTLNQSGSIVTPTLQYSTPNYKMAGYNGNKASYNKFGANLGYNDKGVSGGIDWTNTTPINKNISLFSKLGLGYNQDNVEGLSQTTKIGTNINLLNSRMTRPGDTKLSLNPYAHATLDKNTLSDKPEINHKIGYGINADFRTMVNKNLSVFGQAGVDASLRDFGEKIPLNPYGNIGINYNLEGVKNLLYKKPSPSNSRPRPQGIPESTKDQAGTTITPRSKPF
jgi:hypothetical protein